MKKNLSRDLVKGYIAREGQQCLFCGHGDVHGEFVMIEGGSACQEMSCPKCGEAWTDLYHLTAVVYDGNVIVPTEEVNSLKPREANES